MITLTIKCSLNISFCDQWPHYSVLTFKVVKIHSNKLLFTPMYQINSTYFRPGTYVVTQRRSQSPGHHQGHQERERAPSKAAITDLIDQSELFDSARARTDLMSFVKSYIR